MIIQPIPAVPSTSAEKRAFPDGFHLTNPFTIPGADAQFWESIETTEKIRPKHERPARGRRRLVYWVVGYKPEYQELWRMSAESAMRNPPGPSTEFLVICDAKTSEALPAEIRGRTIHRLIVPESDNLRDICMRRLRVFSWPRIFDFARALYLDCDIICIKNLDRVLGVPIKAGVFHAKHEEFLHNDYAHSLGHWTPGDLFRLQRRGIRCFNSGQFMFWPSNVMQHHFAAVEMLAACWGWKAFHDQAFLNAYFNALEISNTAALEPHVRILFGGDEIRKRETASLLHFAGPIGNAAAKIERMREA